MADAIVEEYTTSLDDLTFNSKPHINALTMLAEEYLPYAELIVGVIEAKLNKASSSGKLPIMYLMDSIVKNVGGNYTPLFAKNIVKSFYSTFDAGEDRVKMSLHKLRSTWDNYLPLKKLYELDVTIHANDPNWPVKPLPANLQDKPSSSIHVNPKFIKKTEPASTSISGIAASLSSRKASTSDSIDLKQDLINKQKQLLELQQQKLLLELEQTKQQLAQKAKRDQVKRQGVAAPKDPRLKAAASTLRVTLPNGQRQAPKDPRAAALSRVKPNPPTQTKKAPDPRVKSSEPKKTVPESEKVKGIKKSPSDSEKQPKKKKASPNNSVKSTTKASKTPSPKTTAKSDAGKKTKVIKKKTEVKAVKLLTEERKVESPKPEKTEREERQKASPREAPKKRERPARRSPPRARPPPAKQPRRSTSVEKRRSPSPPRRIPQPQRHPFSKSMREEELRRESPRAEDGSISPRFSPEPDDGPGQRQGWRPPPKRMRQQEPPAPWRHEEQNMMPAQPARRRSSVDPNLTIPQELTLSHQAEILKQAEIQLQSGQLTHIQHQDLLKQLHQLFELQRLRNFLQQGSLPGQQDDRPRMPLDELLPERRVPEMRHHDRGDFRRGPMHRHDENQPPHFLPPPSPPMMDVDRDDGFRHPPRTRHLTPPPMPPSMVPRMNRNHPPPHMEDPRFQRARDEFPPHPNEPGFRDDRGMPPRHEMDRGPPMMDRRPSPPQQRRGSGSWNNQPPTRRPGYGEDFGNVFVVEEPERFQRHPRHDPGPSNGAQELQNGTKPPMEHVPLRAYAHPESENKERPQDGKQRRSAFDDRRRQRRSPPKKTEPDKHQPPQKKPLAMEQSENEDDGPHLEEPEDYIIANIPPGAEAYHEHSMKLNAHKKSIIASQYTKKLAEGNKEKDSKPSEKKPPPENLPAEAMSSPDVSKRDKLEEEVQKSPSLPLKKRKYLVSSSSDIRDSSDGGVATEPESEPPSAPPKETPPAAVEEELEKKAEEPKEMEVDKIPEKVVEKEVQDQASHKMDENQEIKEPTKQPENKEMKEDTGKHEKQEETQPGEKLDDKTEEKAENPPSEKVVVVKKEPEESLKETKKVGGKKNKRRKKEKNRLQQRMQQLAEDGDKTMQDNGPRGKFGRRNDVAKMNEEERIHGLMMEEEERLRWEAELEMQLGREEFQERASHRGGRMNRSPPRRGGWGRDEDGPWRGRGGPPNRRRGGPPGRGREIWDDGPPFRGRRHFGRMLPRHRGDGRPQWIQLRDDPPPGPGRGPMPNEERIPPLFPDLGRGNDGPPRPLFPPQGPPPPPPQSEMNQVNVNKLLSDLLNMGIIPGAVKKEPENPPTTQQIPNEVQQSPAGAIISSAQAVAAVTPSQSHEELASLPKPNISLESNRVPTPVFEELLTFDPDAKLPNVTLNDVEKLKIRHEEVVKRLYTGIQCSACGMRFTACQTDMYAEHLDWHYRLNRKDRDGVRETHRMLYPTAGEWIMYEEIVDPSQRVKNQVFDEEEENEMEAINEQEDSEDLVVPVAQNPEQDKCAVCNEAFKTVYNDEAEEWQYVNCVAVDDKNFHPSCYADHNDRDSGPLLTPVRVPLYNPLESSIRGIPGLDSLQEDTATDDYVPHNAAQSTSEVTATVGEEVKEERSESSAAKPDEGETAMEMDTAPAPEAEATPMEEEPARDMPEPEKDVPAEMEGLVSNEQAIVKEERSPTPTTDSISAPVQESEEQDESHDMMQEELQVHEEQSSTSESQPTTQEPQEDIIQHNMVKLERSQDSPTMLESIAEAEEKEPPFVTPGNVSGDLGESPHVKHEQSSPTTNSFPPSESADISPDSQVENFAKTEAESDADSAFPIPTLVSVPKIEPVENPMFKFEHDVNPSSVECGGGDDQPPPPGTEPMDEPDVRSETDDESDLDYDDSDINVTL